MAEMNDAKPNGKSPDPREMLDLYLTPIVANTIRGAISSCHQVPPVEVMLAISRVSGRLLSEMMSGDLSDVFKVRKELKSQFDGAVSSAKIHSPPVPPRPETAPLK